MRWWTRSTTRTRCASSWGWTSRSSRCWNATTLLAFQHLMEKHGLGSEAVRGADGDVRLAGLDHPRRDNCGRPDHRRAVNDEERHRRAYMTGRVARPGARSQRGGVRRRRVPGGREAPEGATDEDLSRVQFRVAARKISALEGGAPVPNHETRFRIRKEPQPPARAVRLGELADALPCRCPDRVGAGREPARKPAAVPEEEPHPGKGTGPHRPTWPPAPTERPHIRGSPRAGPRPL